MVDTWVMPGIATALADAAAISSVASVWVRRERSVLSIATLVVAILSGLFFTFLVVAEAIGGV